MPKRIMHVSDEELLLFADGEVASGRAENIREHLTACRTCSIRISEIETTNADIRQVHRQTFDPQVTPADGSRALLRIRMAEKLAASGQSAWFPRISGSFFGQSFFGRSFGRSFAYVGAVVFFLLLGLSVDHYLRGSRGAKQPVALLEAEPIPNNRLTPGATRSVSLSDICFTGHRDMNRDVPMPVRQKVLREYGLVSANPGDYEIDYLITPELGGSSDIRNLWPEPYLTTEWNAYVKDALEDRFHSLVCSGKIDLVTAQQAIAKDWISGYKNYFHTDKPFPNHSYPSADQTNREEEKESGNTS